MGLEAQIHEDMKDAMRSGDSLRRRTLRQVRAAIKNAAIEQRGGLDDDDIRRVLAREAKQRRDAIEQFESGDRQDLAEAERQELEVIEAYLPAKLREDEVASIARSAIEDVDAVGPADMGRVMGVVMERVGTRADGGMVSQIVARMLREGTD